ncbi:PA1571 family protein [Pseudomonas schmalbachii]|uniref:Multifunctional fatty acid oxidation complex subunit alpha n=1 Tax=Pseudomonas schmalbachii TaxID=2816993 RepID=A0ABS3TWL0_9PSED|nr:PA1571 family protein [Pseudomonas schmalbachii]MBO3278074.1 hypothetical protein [Pseudomonas schmalbachii]
MSIQDSRNVEPRPAPQPGAAQQSTGGAIIDAEGHEIPITEEMIQRACKQLDESCDEKSG